MFFSVFCLLCLCKRLFICALWSPAGRGLGSWLSFVVYNCEFVTFQLVSWVKCGSWLYRFQIFASSLTLNALMKLAPGINTIKYHTWPRIPHAKVTKWKLSSQTRAKRPTLSQQVATRQQCVDAKAPQTQDINNTNDPQKITTLERSVKYLTEGLKPVSRRQPHP